MVIFDRKTKKNSAKLTAFLPTYKITTSLNILARRLSLLASAADAGDRNLNNNK